MDKWMRIVANATADTNSNDTTETQIGSGIACPSWAKSVIAGIFELGDVTQTTAESVSGYVRVYTDNNDVDPLYYPMPVISANLAGAAAGQMHFPVSFPIMQNIGSNDTIRMAAAFDIATTGVHRLGGYFLFSSKPSPIRLHCQKMAYTEIGDALAESTSVDIQTISEKTSRLLGILGYGVIGGTGVAAYCGSSYMRVKSALAGWQEQQLALNHENACLGADSYTITMPVVYLYKDSWALMDWFDGVHKRCLGMDSYPVKGKETFSFTAQHTHDPEDTQDRGYRAFLLWQE